MALACVTVFLLALPALLGPRFDLNLLNLQSEGLESVRWEERLMRDSAAASWYAVSVADSLDEAAALEARAKEEAVILRTESALSLIKPETNERRVLRQTIAEIGLGEAPAAPVFIDGEKSLTLRGEHIASEFQGIVENYIENRFGSTRASSEA